MYLVNRQPLDCRYLPQSARARLQTDFLSCSQYGSTYYLEERSLEQDNLLECMGNQAASKTTEGEDSITFSLWHLLCQVLLM